jgi:phosphoglycolate phosphatase-like HAD superfamily hydrolase
VGALLLFDIDGTLVRGAATEHAAAIHEAIRRVFNVTVPADLHLETAGKTDLEIAREMVQACNVPVAEWAEGRSEFRIAAVEGYANLAPRDLSDKVLPGVPELLERLAQRTDVALSLVTGNLEPIARLKLARAGLGAFFARGQGGFGSDDEDRAALPAIARERAGTKGNPYPRERTWVIGDTPRDIACARADDVGVLCVATGPYPATDLLEADAVAASMVELGALLDERL